MNTLERLRQVTDHEQDRLRASVPADCPSAILALIAAQDQLPQTTGVEAEPDLITGRRLTNLGGNKSLQLCFESTGASLPAAAASDQSWDGWTRWFLQQCNWLAEAEQVLAHCETGFMRMVDDGSGTFHAWVATKRPPTSWQERADFDWWASWLARRLEPELRALQSQRPGTESGDIRDDAIYRRLADLHLEKLAYQLGFPPDAVIGGCTIQIYRDVLGQLLAWALRARDRGEVVTPRSEHALIAALASGLAIDPAVISTAVAAFTLDRENAAYHAAAPGIAAAPLIRVEPGRLVWSVHGLTTEPLFFLTRELKRRAAQEYHNAAVLREAVFRKDLYALFPDKRFVTSTGRIELRREGGDVRTDIDAVAFDRKTGTLGFFELKSQDPFARSTAELARQRDSVLYANRQVSGVLAWLNRHGADALLSRVDSRTARTFRVHKVYPFVLGRYLVHFSDGPEPDRRAAWGTWPQVLRLLDGGPARATDANPIASLFTRLRKDVPRVQLPAETSSREIAIGEARLTVHPSYAAFQASTAATDGSRCG